MCNAVRGLAEAIGANRKLIEDEFFNSLDPIFEALAEHPLDVVRVNIWKMFKMSTEAKLGFYRIFFLLKFSRQNYQIRHIIFNPYISFQVLSKTKLQFGSR